MMECLSLPDPGPLARAASSAERPARSGHRAGRAAAPGPVRVGFPDDSRPSPRSTSRPGRISGPSRHDGPATPAEPDRGANALAALPRGRGDHLGLRADADHVVRRRHRPDPERAGRRLRQRTLRHLARGRRQRRHRRHQPPGRDLPGRPGDRQVVGLLRPEHRHPAARPDPDLGARNTPAPPPAWSTGTTSPSTAKGTSTASPRCSSPRSTGRPGQERDLPDRPRRHVHGRLHHLLRQLAELGQADLQPVGHPDPAGRAAELPPRPDRRHRHRRGDRSSANAGSTTFAALYFDSTQFRPGHAVSTADPAHGRQADRRWPSGPRPA